MVLQSIKTAWGVFVTGKGGATHQQRMEKYYAGQIENYDQTRKGFLHGRKELWESIAIPQDGVWVDFGGGTGANFEFLGDKIDRLSKIIMVDLSQSMLEKARVFIAQKNWTNVSATQGDATCFKHEGQVDIVTFAYSLTMIPDWYAAIENAYALLKPGGTIGVVDFYISRKYAEPLRQHHWVVRNGAMLLRDVNNINVSPDHLPYLCNRFEKQSLDELYGKFSTLPLFRSPYYRFIGRKPV